MNKAYYTQGWTLVELMITVAIIGVLASIAVPSYNNYIRTSQYSTARANADGLALFQEAYFYENDQYLAGTYYPPAVNQFALPLEWVPAGDDGEFNYTVTLFSGADCTAPKTQCYTVKVDWIDDPTITQTVYMHMPTP